MIRVSHCVTQKSMKVIRLDRNEWAIYQVGVPILFVGFCDVRTTTSSTSSILKKSILCVSPAMNKFYSVVWNITQALSVVVLLSSHREKKSVDLFDVPIVKMIHQEWVCFQLCVLIEVSFDLIYWQLWFSLFNECWCMRIIIFFPNLHWRFNRISEEFPGFDWKEVFFSTATKTAMHYAMGRMHYDHPKILNFIQIPSSFPFL